MESRFTFVLATIPSSPRKSLEAGFPETGTKTCCCRVDGTPMGMPRESWRQADGFAKLIRPAKNWEVFSMGYRNEYDIAFNADGELFSYDADMEWDLGSPWYRPTRVVHATSGSEFGWRSGTGKWPTYYEDSLPPAVDIGPRVRPWELCSVTARNFLRSTKRHSSFWIGPTARSMRSI